MLNGCAHLTEVFIISPCALYAKTTLPTHKVITASKCRQLLKVIQASGGGKV